MIARLFALIVVAFLAAVSVPLAFGDNYVEFQNVLTNGDYDPTVDVYVGERFNGGSVGWSAFLLTCKGWSEAVAGPTWAPLPWLELWSGVGVETDDDPFRFAGSVWLGSTDNARSVLFIREEGGSGHYNKGIAQFRVFSPSYESVYFGFGAHYQTPYGAGPHLNVGSDFCQVWGTAFIGDRDTSAVIIGFVRTF